MDHLAKLVVALPALPALRQKPLASAAAGLALYILLVRALRFRRRDKIVRDYGYPKRTLASMTVDEAYEIHKKLSNLEFPETIKTALFFALFKVSPPKPPPRTAPAPSPRQKAPHQYPRIS